MKTVKGKVHSTTSISISKAANILSKFVFADTGTSQAVCAYLRRASLSFNELSQLHKEFKSHRKHKTSKSDVITEDEKQARSGLLSQPELSQEPPSHGDGVESERKKHKKMRKEKGELGNEVEENEGQIVEGKIVITIEENLGQVFEVSEKKKHKKPKHKEGSENGNLKKNRVEIVIEEEKVKKKKKRKSGEIEEGKENHLEELQSKKKKKRKTGVE